MSTKGLRSRKLDFIASSEFNGVNGKCGKPKDQKMFTNSLSKNSFQDTIHFGAPYCDQNFGMLTG